MFKNRLASGFLVRSSVVGIGLVSILLVACNKEKTSVPKEQEDVPEASQAPVNYSALPNEVWTDRTKERLQYIRDLGDNKRAILSIAVDGTDQRLVVSPGFLDSAGMVSMTDTPRRSPDRRYVAFAGTNKDDDLSVAILDLKTRTGKVVGKKGACEPGWSMDGSSLFFFNANKEVAYRMASGKIDTVKGDNPGIYGQLTFAARTEILGFTKTGYVTFDYAGMIKRKSDFISKVRENVEMSSIGAISWDGKYLVNRFSREVIVVDLAHADSIAFRDSLPERAMSLNADGKTIYYASSKTVTVIGLNWETGSESKIMDDDVEHISGLTTLFKENDLGIK